jgi:glycosyltransferase 2 family protein
MRRLPSNTVVTLLKFAVAAAILTYLIVSHWDAVGELKKQSMDWPMLVAALVATFAMVVLNVLRWHILILALGFEMPLIETFRLGAIGFLLNFVSPGSIGGDFFKAILLAHNYPGRRTEAVATIMADRVMGLLTMLLFATVGILATDLLHTGSEAIRLLCQGILLMTAVCWIGCAVLLLAGVVTGGSVARRSLRIPLVGSTISRLLGTVEVYRGQFRMLMAAFAVSIVMCFSYVASYYLMALGLPSNQPSFAQHFVIVPVAGLVGAVPITPSGLGTTEAAIAEMYKTLPGGTNAMAGQGMLVGIGRRLCDVAVAIMGLAFYLSQRREVRAAFAEIDKEPVAESASGVAE